VQQFRFFGRPAVVSRFQRMRTTDTLGQTFLFSGPEGSGKETTALEIARVFNCVDPRGCGESNLCESCRKAVTFQHPDIRWIGPAPAATDEDTVRALLEAKKANPFYQPPFAKSSRVSIGDPEHPGALTIRSLIHFLRVHAFQGRFKVAVIADAHRLTAGAANAFLKTLEEPSPATLIFLLTASAGALLPTIRSRCQQIRFEPYPTSELTGIIAAVGGVSDGRAAELAHLSDGNARRGIGSLQPHNRALLNWAGEIFGWLQTGRLGTAYLAADQIHIGAIPEQFAPEDLPSRQLVAKESVEKRERAILLCEMLNLYYSETLACRARGDSWQPRLTGAALQVREAADRRRSATLLRDIANIEGAKRDIDRNLNIGLSLAVLFQGLIDNVERDRATGRT